jgi:hypothetical protein
VKKINFFEIIIRSHGGVMVSVLPIGPKVHGFKPNHSNGFLRVMEIHCMPSFIREVKPSAPCYNILQLVKEL